VVVSASNKVRSYDPATGKLIWECAGLGTNVIPAPVSAEGVVYVMSGHRDPNLLAIRLGRQGDLTGTDAIAWTNNRGNSYTASPVLHDSKLYLATEDGDVVVVKMGETYEALAVNTLTDQVFIATPAIAGGSLYLRSQDALYCVRQ
jgi:outer membrane protein assembly factor BamB